jgi:hypothetical protein
MTPLLFTFGSKYGNKVVFGLIDGLDLWPIRVVASNKVQRLGEKPITVPAKFDLVAAGDACMKLLDEAEVLEPLLHAMADDMYKAFCAAHVKKPKPKKPKPPPFDLATYLMERDHDGT